MVECTMTIQRRRFRPAVFVRSDYDGITFPAGASSAEGIAALSFWVQEPDFRNVRRPVEDRLYCLFTVADRMTGQPARYLYQVTPEGLREAWGGRIDAADVSFSWSGLECGSGGKSLMPAAISA